MHIFRHLKKKHNLIINKYTLIIKLSFPSGLPATERLGGTAAAAAIGIFNGANIIRVHDVKEMVRVAGIADGIKRWPEY